MISKPICVFGEVNMKSSLIALILLVFESINSLEYSISNDDKSNKDRTSVYSVQEDPEANSIRFVHPWSDKPTLREIVYYHVIEKPYGEDMAETERPFTNAHGLPFYKENNIDDAVIEDSNLEPEILTEIITVPVPDDNSDMIVNDQAVTEDTTRNPEEGPIETERKPRGQLFNEIKDKYKKKYDENAKEDETVDHARTKRNAIKEEIPEAPAIPRVRYESFPAYLRQLISTERPDSTKVEEADKKRTKASQKKKTINERMDELEGMLRSLNEEVDLSEQKEDVSPNTYGMRLNAEGGYVWNDIFTNPGISYEVGDPGLHPESLIEKEDIPTADENASLESLDTVEGHSENDSQELDDIFVHISKSESKTPPTSEDDINYEDETDDELNEVDINMEEDDVTQIIAEIVLQSDEFWEWATNWTETIVDVLKTFTKKFVKTEVKKQLQTQLEEHYEKTLLVPQKDIAEDSKGDKIKSNNFEIKDNKLIIDGSEIPLIDIFNYITGNETDDEENLQNDNRLRSRKNKKKKPSSSDDGDKKIEDKKEIKKNKIPENDSGKNQTAYTVDIQNVYGNAVGSDKVTNVFIFYPDKGIDKVIQELKPIAGEDGTFIFKPDGEKVEVHVKENEENNEEKIDNNEEIEKKDDTEEVPLQKEKEDTEPEVEEKETESKTEPTESEKENSEQEETSSKTNDSKDKASDIPESEPAKDASKDSEKSEELNEEREDDDQKGVTLSQNNTDTSSAPDNDSDDKKDGDTVTSESSDKEAELDKTEEEKEDDDQKGVTLSQNTTDTPSAPDNDSDDKKDGDTVTSESSDKEAELDKTEES